MPIIVVVFKITLKHLKFICYKLITEAKNKNKIEKMM